MSDEASKPDTNPNAFAESLQYVRRFVADEVQSTEFSFIAHERVWMDGWVPTKRDCTEELRNHLTVMLDALECMRELCQSAEKYQEQLEEHNVELIRERDAAVQRLATSRQRSTKSNSRSTTSS